MTRCPHNLGGSTSPNNFKMRWRWATLSSVLIAVRPVDASYISKSPQTIEPTRAAVAMNHLLGISPRITDAPVPDPRSLVGRAGALERESNTCGFYSDGYPLLCYTSTATCAFESKFAACCDRGTTCSSIFTGCYPFSDSLKGSCASDKLKTQPQMACCFDSSVPNCVLHTLLISSTSLGIWGCATTTTGETIYSTKPVDKTSSDSTSPSMSASKSTSSSTSRTTSFTSETSAKSSTDNNDGEKKSNTGAIVGGVVGGVGGAAILGAAIFFFMRSRKKKSVDSGSATAATSQPVFQQYQQSPLPGQGSPLGYHPQAGSPVYDPNTAYKHYQGSPQPYPQPSQSPFDPHRSGHQSWGQPSPGLTSSPSPLGSPNPVSPTATTPGPTTMEQQHGQPVELAESNAVGTSANRAEMA
ncbi:hypothetical protein BB8028_0003g05140 [Beauveria bassiana]|uniref:Uncharacterized protein n=1 Tax=Beauveria bassiana TaxID=176275 RepID=A0A2S7Y786_BEABA|nr:hypothetical protein BB8028_0003g05140 [Beauveria bassiana]